MEAGGVHIIQTFFSRDASEEIQIQGRTARQGKKGSYSLILAESEIKELKLDPEELRDLPPKQRHMKLRNTWKESQAKQKKANQKALKKADSLDRQSHSYFDALLQGNCHVAKEKLKDLYKELRKVQSTGYHVVCCYDESTSMKRYWGDLQAAHQTCMKTLQGMPSVLVSIIQFSNGSRTILKCAQPDTAAEITLTCEGRGTCFEPALADARELLTFGKKCFPTKTPVLFFMSDGHNEHEDSDCKQTIRAIQAEHPNLLFHAVIFRLPDSERLRGMVGAAGKGQFHVSADGVKLQQTFCAIARELELDYTGS